MTIRTLWTRLMNAQLLMDMRNANYSEDGCGVEPLDTEHFASDPQYPIEKLDAKFRRSNNGDPTL